MVAENDSLINRMISESLELHGFHVEKVWDGQAALDLFPHIDPSLVIIEVDMPSVAGIDFCRCIRRNSKVPVLLLTDYLDADVLIDTWEAGANACLEKPFEIKDLIDQVSKML
jgi:DNA-binding response OmpR family regulator